MECDAEKLLSLVEQRPALYDFRMKEHSDRVLTERLWEEIASEMELSVAKCRAKWASLRSSYARAMREGQNRSGSGPKKKRWYLLEAMQFLTEFINVNRIKDIGGKSEDDNQADELDKNIHSPEKGIQFSLRKSNCTNPQEPENTTVTFLNALLPDIEKLCEPRKRKFKQAVLSELYRQLDEQENVIFCDNQMNYTPAVSTIVSEDVPVTQSVPNIEV